MITVIILTNDYGDFLTADYGDFRK